MKSIKTTKLWLLPALVCLLVLVVAGMAFAMNSQTTIASADATSDLSFTLFNNNTEYRVSALNKQLTIADIPETYNGLPVTEISDNGFLNCAKLRLVRIPKSVTRVGTNAFINCKELVRVIGMPNIENIGNNAFAMCPKLDKLILPNSINTLGSTILRNNPNEVYVRMSEPEIMALNASWSTGRPATAVTKYGTEIVHDEVYDENGIMIGYEIRSWQSISSPEEDLILYSSLNGYPVLNVREYAFCGNAVKSLTLIHNENENFTHTVNVCSNAFLSLMADSVAIQVDISLDDPNGDIEETPGKSASVFAGAYAKHNVAGFRKLYSEQHVFGLQ